VILGLTYGFLPFMILPLYASIERMDSRWWRRATTSPRKTSTLFRLIIPDVAPGLIAGDCSCSFPRWVTTSPRRWLPGLGREHADDRYHHRRPVRERNNWPLGSAMSVLLMAFILIGVFVYLRRVGEDAL